MTVAEWISLAAILVSATGVVITYSGLAATRRSFSERSGADRQRLETLERWQQNDSVDRSQFEGHTKRLDDLEAAMHDVGELKTEIAVHRAEFKGFRELQARDTEELKHGQRNTKAALDKLTDLMMEVRSWAPPKASRRTAAAE